MLIFARPHGTALHSAAHPTEARKTGYTMPTQLQKSLEESWRQVGTARRENDGTWVLDLKEIPAGHELVMRPPRSGENASNESPNSK